MNNKQWFIKINDENILVTEDVYRAYKRPIWSEQKKIKRNGKPLSLDWFLENGYEIADSIDMLDETINNIYLEKLNLALKRLDTTEKMLILALFYQEQTEREYAKYLGISHQAVNKKKKKVLEKLFEYIKN